LVQFIETELVGKKSTAKKILWNMKLQLKCLLDFEIIGMVHLFKERIEQKNNNPNKVNTQ
jgi:hypothetical protein